MLNQIYILGVINLVTEVSVLAQIKRIESHEVRSLCSCDPETVIAIIVAGLIYNLIRIWQVKSVQFVPDRHLLFSDQSCL